MSRDNLIVPILEISDDSLPNDDEVEKTKPSPISLAKKPVVTKTGITSFLDLPVGVGPAEECENIEVNFPDVDDSAALDVDDEFSYTGDASFATLRPAKDDTSLPTVTELQAQEMPEDTPLNDTVINNTNATVHSTEPKSKPETAAD